MQRRARCLALLLLPALLAAASFAYVNRAGAAAQPRELRFACALKSNGLMRFATSPSRCNRRREKAIRISTQGKPVLACVVTKPKKARKSAAKQPLITGSTRFAARSSVCRQRSFGRQKAIFLPGKKPTFFCVRTRGGLLRFARRPRCRRGEFAAVVSERDDAPPPSSIPPNRRPPTAADDSSSTGEDDALAVAVLDNDNGAGGALLVARVDTAGTKGQVTVNPDQTVSYDPRGRFDALAPGETGSDSFRYTATDGTVDSNAATVTVSVSGANEAPALADIEPTPLAYTAGEPAAGITTAVTASDPDGSTLSEAKVSIDSGFVTGNDELSFSDQNGISGSFDSGSGTLTLSGSASVADYQSALRSVEYETALATPTGNRTIGFEVDDGSSANEASNVVTRNVAVTHVNQNPVATDDSFTGALGNTKLAVGTTSAGPVVQISGNVLANDDDLETSAAGLTASADTETAKGGDLSMNADGSFVYTPPQGFAGGDDAFDYTLHDNDPDAKTDTGTVDIEVGEQLIWYVDNALAAAGDGRSTAPFNSLVPLTNGGSANGADGARDIIFLYQGSSAYAGGIVLETGQQLIGQPQGLEVAGNTLVAAGGSNPSVRNAAGDAINLANGSGVQRVDVAGTTTGAGIRGTNVASSIVGDNTSISGAAGGALALSGAATGNVTIGADITQTGSAKSVSIANRTGGTVALPGDVTDTGGGVALQNNTGATVNLTGVLDLSTASGNDAFSATGGGTVRAGNAANTAAATTGAAVRIVNTTIGSGGVTFESTSASGGASGIVLDHTGSTAGLTVTGTGTANSGGTISSSTSHAVSLNTTSGLSLARINITSPQHAGIKGTAVSGFSLTNSTISGAGTAHNDPDDAALAFNAPGSTNNNLSGVVSITSNTLSNPFGGGIDVESRAGTISDLTVTGNAISSLTSLADSNEDGISFNLFGSSSTVASLTKATISTNSVSGFPNGGGISLQGGNTASSTAPAGTYGTYNQAAPGSGTNTVSISGNTVAGNATNKMNNDGIRASVTGRGQGNFLIQNNGTAGNPIANVKGAGIAIGAAGSPDASFSVSGNFVSPASIVNSSGIALGTNVNTQADLSTLSDPDVDALIQSNTVSNTDGPGIRVLHRDSNGTANVQITGNTVGAPLSAGNTGIRVESGSDGSATFDPTLCTNIQSNTTTGSAADGSGARPGIQLLKRSNLAATYVFGIVGLTPSPATPAQTESFVTTANPNSALGSGTFAGKRVAVTAGDQFTAATLPCA